MRQYKPRNSSLRNKTGFDFTEITAKKPEKSLIEGLSKKICTQQLWTYYCPSSWWGS